MNKYNRPQIYDSETCPFQQPYQIAQQYSQEYIHISKIKKWAFISHTKHKYIIPSNIDFPFCLFYTISTHTHIKPKYIVETSLQRISTASTSTIIAALKFSISIKFFPCFLFVCVCVCICVVVASSFYYHSFCCFPLFFHNFLLVPFVPLFGEIRIKTSKNNVSIAKIMFFNYNYRLHPAEQEKG